MNYMKIKEILTTYDDNSSKLKELNIKTIDVIKSIILGYGLGLLIVISPIIILYNMFIYEQFQTLLIFLITLFCWVFFLLSDIFYHKMLTIFEPKVKEIPFKYNHIVNAVIYFVMCMIAFIFIILLL